MDGKAPPLTLRLIKDRESLRLLEAVDDVIIALRAT